MAPSSQPLLGAADRNDLAARPIFGHLGRTHGAGRSSWLVNKVLLILATAGRTTARGLGGSVAAAIVLGLHHRKKCLQLAASGGPSKEGRDADRTAPGRAWDRAAHAADAGRQLCRRRPDRQPALPLRPRTHASGRHAAHRHRRAGRHGRGGLRPRPADRPAADRDHAGRAGRPRSGQPRSSRCWAWSMPCRASGSSPR